MKKCRVTAESPCHVLSPFLHGAKGFVGAQVGLDLTSWVLVHLIQHLCPQASGAVTCGKYSAPQPLLGLALEGHGAACASAEETLALGKSLCFGLVVVLVKWVKECYLI